jgi:hypothetical protein
MSFHEQSTYITAESAEALDQFSLVKYDTAGKVVKCTATTDIPCGVVQVACESGEQVSICVNGLTNLIAGGVITAGTDNYLIPTTAGKVIKFTSGANVNIVARFLPYQANLVSSNGEVIRGFFAPNIGNA